MHDVPIADQNCFREGLKTRVNQMLQEIGVPVEWVTDHLVDGILNSLLQAMRRGAKGIKVRLGGRLGGAEMSRTLTEKEGRVPLQTLRANIDYAIVHAATTYGRIGVKVWIYKGDVLPERTQVPEPTRSAAD